jgi:hypothetical protein
MNIHNLLEDIVLTSYVISNSKGYWYVVPVDYWVMNHWEQWGILWSIPDTEKGLKFLEIIEKFRVDSKELNSFFRKTSEANKMKLHPQVFANFDKKEFYTTFGEWALENAVLDSWKGVRAEFKERIPVEEQFWKKSIEA